MKKNKTFRIHVGLLYSKWTECTNITVITVLVGYTNIIVQKDQLYTMMMKKFFGTRSLFQNDALIGTQQELFTISDHFIPTYKL